jgi:hypothetical protein
VNRTDLAVVAGLLTAVCVIPYLRDIYRGTTRPQRVSWLVFAVLSIVAAVSQFMDGAYAGAWLTGGAALGFTLVFLVSIRRGVGGMSFNDALSLIVASCGLGVSLAVQEPFIAVLAVVVAEVPAVSLTVQKALRDPKSETASTWLIDGLAGVCALLAVSELSLAQVLYPLHHIVANSCVLAAIVLRGHAPGPAGAALTGWGRKGSARFQE